MSQLTKRVVLIHELWQLRRSEEFFYRCSYWLYVDQGLWWNSFQILSCHSLSYDSFHSGQTDSVLVLKKFSYRTDTSVTQVVDIVIITQTILQMHIVVNRSHDIFFCNMLRNQIMDISLDSCFQLINISCCFLKEICKYRIVNKFCYTNLFRINVNNFLQIYHHIRKNFDISLFFRSVDPYIRNSSVLDPICNFSCHLCSSLSDYLACNRAYCILRKNMSWNTVLEKKLFIEFITSYFRQIITSWVEEHTCDQTFCTVNGKRLTWTDLLI